MKRRLVILVVVPAVATLGLFFARGQARNMAPVNVRAEIGPGMGEEQVVAALGCPPGDYVGSRKRFTMYGSPGYVDPQDPGPAIAYSRQWICEDGTVYVSFGCDGKVVHVSYGIVVIDERTWLEKIVDGLRSCFK